MSTSKQHQALTERQVNNEIMRPEVALHIAVRAREVRDGRAPAAGVDPGRAIAHLERDALAVPRPEPDLDPGVGALHRVPAAAVRVERGSVRVRGRVLHATARVGGRVDVAVCPERDARLVARSRDGAVYAVGRRG